MEKTFTKSTLNGSSHQGNFIWGGAMNLAWSELCHSINNGPLNLSLNSQSAGKMVVNFNNSPFSTKDLDPESYYVKSGYGQTTLDIINTEVKKKFPAKTFPPLTYKLDPTDIISYAYFLKQVQYLVPFAIAEHFYFQPSQAQVRGFKASNHEQRQNVEIVEYKSDEQFTVRLKLKQPNEQLYLVKGSRERQPQQIVSSVMSEHKVQSMAKDDHFAMPVVDLDVTRNYDELIGAAVESGKLKGYRISVMIEKIKFKIDEVGAKVENEAVIIMTKCAVMHVKKPKRLILDDSFWVVMKQKGSYPYFVAQINNSEYMMTKK